MAPMTDSMTLHDALAEAATGDVWLFRGRSPADRAIRFFTNSPVNHVGVVLALPVAAVIAVFLRHALDHYRASDIYGGD